MFDILIQGGTVVDGTGASGRRCDVAVKNGQVVKLAPTISADAAKVIDATGKTVAPGFIDPHTHEEFISLVDGTFEMYLRQGVTTVVTGNCSHSVSPGPLETILEYYYLGGMFSSAQVERYAKTFPRWEDFAGYREHVKGTSSVNLATLMGHGSMRFAVMGGSVDRPMNGEEWVRFERILRHELEAGAFGISFGLDYLPSRAADFDELCKIGRVIAEYDAVCASHQRNDNGLVAATEEMLRLAEATGCRLQISHLQSQDGVAFDMVRQAAEKGARVLCDTIPLSTGHCMSKERLRQFLSAADNEIFKKGPQGVVEALKTKEGREILKTKAYVFNGNTDDKFIVHSPDPALEGKSIAQIAKERGIDDKECFLDLAADDLEYTFWMGGPERPNFTPRLECVRENPYICVGTDEIMGDVEDPYDWYELQRRCGFPNFFSRCLELGVPVEEIVRRNTSMVAEQFGLKGRGVLKEGSTADITIFTPSAFCYHPPVFDDYKQAEYYPDGIDTVLVNGALAMERGALTGSRSGEVLIRQRSFA